MMQKIIILTTLLLFSITISAQTRLVVKGKISDENNNAISNVSVIQVGTTNGTTTSHKGYYAIEVEYDDSCVIEFSGLAYLRKSIVLFPSNKATIYKDITLSKGDYAIDTVEITATKTEVGKSVIEAKSAEYFPNPTGDAGTLVKTMGQGVQSNNELSGQYNVRGGNYDENLVYINDFEIYRPFLVSSSQQEGLSFTNLDLTDKLSFSGGGFESKYGDKMSSVLNIKYKNPTTFKGSVMASILGVNAHVEGAAYPKKDTANENAKFTYLVGLRYKSNGYLLGSLDKKGEYNPNFFDVQADFHIKPNVKHDIEILVNHSFNDFKFTPVTEETRAGTFDQLIRFLVDFDGGEKDRFQNTMLGISYKYLPNTKLSLKFLTTFWKMRESETFNITGYYSLDEIEIDPSNENFGNVKDNLGIGTFQDWARNKLDAVVSNFSHIGKYIIKDKKNEKEKHLLEWGSTFQFEKINDELSEWQRIDSAGYSIPYSGTSIQFPYRLKTANNLTSFRVHGYFQDTWNIINTDSTKLILTAGVRYNFWNVNKEFLVSPRVQLLYHPKLKSDVTFRLAGGMYVQPPFYRELRGFDGNINKNIKAQQSYHVVIGADYNFKIKKRNFKLTAEAYYKHIRNLNPYEIQDVRIRYFANNDAKGYATGIDVRLFGEMIKGADSWITLSYLNTRENLNNDMYYTYRDSLGKIYNSPNFTNNRITDTLTNYPGYIRRPTDQALFVSLYFQDYIEKYKRFKVHFNLVIGTGLPFGPPDKNRYKDVLKMPPYRRLDIGFSALLLNGAKRAVKKPNSFGSKFENIWASFEVFNIIGIRNTLSYRWIKDTENNLWAIPNYLTSRRFNVKLHITW
ncbi:MAG TPA: carboxypeptidase-like regulatory domain-containing protein [Chitinophagales bacterium]|nr:carboxypeptidase-like regulatory domain-containing protein [Chitinophagales bacterium]HMW12851.1 carboxypeptidase-like regulatory domain-containing protein [Chitinophagales bacterium]HMX60464.1 carboxypeptidase-like regulatory domain-containing protein [Chitinophagales bacterium]HMZ34111.1 carboxypeptidase-like regulatory domain-containing protein [Chitinophagales bacterium]HNA38083.1 carboxypeptidase-like regulatory domain-containing protein [Chitinophagales bacterium]